LFSETAVPGLGAYLTAEKAILYNVDTPERRMSLHVNN